MPYTKTIRQYTPLYTTYSTYTPYALQSVAQAPVSAPVSRTRRLFFIYDSDRGVAYTDKTLQDLIGRLPADLY